MGDDTVVATKFWLTEVRAYVTYVHILWDCQAGDKARLRMMEHDAPFCSA